MTTRKRRWLASIPIIVSLGFVALIIAGHSLARRLDPYIRQQAILYLEQRFYSDVEIASLTVSLPHLSPLKMLFSHGRGTMAFVEVEGLSLRYKGRRDVPALFSIKRFSGEIDLGTLFDTQKKVQSVTIDEMDITIPPKNTAVAEPVGNADNGAPPASLIIEEVMITDSSLNILPKDSRKTPLRFDIHRAQLETVGRNDGMKYDAALLNANPPGEILIKGTFGPWVADAPGSTPIQGEYDFQKADLGVFSGIKGILSSTGQFSGSLSALAVSGQAYVPDFRLTWSGNPVPLKTQFSVVVDGTNGNTLLKPVTGTIGSTGFKTSGGVVKHVSDPKRTVDHHIKEEESDMFKKATTTGIDFDVLGTDMAQLKRNLKKDGVPPDAEAKMVKKSGLRGDSPAKKAQETIQVPLKD